MKGWIRQRHHLLIDVCINLKVGFLALEVVSAVKDCDCPRTDKHFSDTIGTSALIYSRCNPFPPLQSLVAAFPKGQAAELPVLRHPTSDPVSQHVRASPSHPVPWFSKSTLSLVSRATG